MNDILTADPSLVPPLPATYLSSAEDVVLYQIECAYCRFQISK
jgi:hypothetical protein